MCGGKKQWQCASKDPVSDAGDGYCTEIKTVNSHEHAPQGGPSNCVAGEVCSATGWNYAHRCEASLCEEVASDLWSQFLIFF